jgi:uncharacterized protein (TIGR03067 family)
MNRVAHLFAVILTVALAPSARADTVADDWKALAGTWKVEKATLGGQDMSESLKTLVLIIEEGKYKLVTDSGTIAIEPDKKPKVMTIKGTDGPNKGKTFPAIYEIDKDTLTICYDLSGKEPPTAFESKAGTKLFLVSYKREKK